MLENMYCGKITTFPLDILKLIFNISLNVSVIDNNLLRN